MKFLIKNTLIFVLVSFILISPVLSLAQNVNTPATGTPPTTINNPIPKVTSVTSFIKTILVGLIKIGIPIVALAIIYSGFLFVMARGNPESLKTAKSALLYSVIGAAIVLGAWAIAQLISETVLEIGNSV